MEKGTTQLILVDLVFENVLWSICLIGLDSFLNTQQMYQEVMIIKFNQTLKSEKSWKQFICSTYMQLILDQHIH